MKTYHMGIWCLVLLARESKWLDSCPEWWHYPKGGACKTHTQIHRLQENVLLPERYTNGTVHMPPAQCPEDSFAKEEIHALYLEGWLPFWQKDVKQRPCEGGRRHKDWKLHGLFWKEGPLQFSEELVWQNYQQPWRDRWRDRRYGPDQCHALRSLKGYRMVQQREPCADLLVWVLVQLPTNYVALGHSCVSEERQQGLVITVLPPSQGYCKVQ